MLSKCQTKKLDAIDSFKNDDFTNENLKKMSIAKIMELVGRKYNDNINTLNEFSYDELVGMLVEDNSEEMMDEIEEIGDAIQSCELYKLNHQDKLKFLNDMKKNWLMFSTNLLNNESLKMSDIKIMTQKKKWKKIMNLISFS